MSDDYTPRPREMRLMGERDRALAVARDRGDRLTAATARAEQAEADLGRSQRCHQLARDRAEMAEAERDALKAEVVGLREVFTVAADAHDKAMRDCHCEACVDACDALLGKSEDPAK